MKPYLLLLTAVAHLSASAASVQPVECGATAPAEGQVELLDGGSANLNAWSHITAEGEELEGLQQNANAYAARLRPAAEPPCPLPVYNLLLVKKYHDWHQQHLSGLEVLFPKGPVPLKDIQGIRLRLRIDSGGTRIPSAETYRKTYQDWLTQEQLTELDNQQVTLELTLFDANHAEPSIPSLKGSYLLSLDPLKDLDQWLEVRLPVEEMNWVLQQNWENVAVDRGRYVRHQMVGLRINPETSSGKVARHFLAEDYGPGVPKLYKEISISLESASYLIRTEGKQEWSEKQ